MSTRDIIHTMEELSIRLEDSKDRQVRPINVARIKRARLGIFGAYKIVFLQ